MAQAGPTTSQTTATTPDQRFSLEDFELILPKIVSVLTAIQQGLDERDIVRLVPSALEPLLLKSLGWFRSFV